MITTEQEIDAAIIEIDRLISAQLDAILHHPKFRALEARWRALRWLAVQVAPNSSIRLRLLAASWSDIGADMQRHDDVRLSDLYQKIYQAEFNTAGGEPFGLLVIDQEVSHLPGDDGVDDAEVLGRLAVIAAAAFAPLVIAASPVLLADDLPHRDTGFGVLAGVADPAVQFELPAYAKWRAMRDRPETRFVALVLPRVLARPPWRDQTERCPGFRYDEGASGAADRVWMTACAAFAAVVIRAVSRYGWPADIRGIDTGRTGGGIVTFLPEEPFLLSETFTLPRTPLDIVLRESQERGIDGTQEEGLLAAGFIPLMALPFGTEPAFCSSRSLYRMPAAGRHGGEAFANGAVASQINAVLCASRFAHAIKVKGRDMVGRLRRAEDIECELRGWLLPYVNGSMSAKAELRARCPLVRARVEVQEAGVQEAGGRTGVFGCVMHLQPYFQLDTLASEFRFETELGAEVAAAGGSGAL